MTAAIALPSRDELLERGLPIVRRVAFRMARRLPPNVDVGDLIGSGSEGLLKAVQSYDPERFPRFEPYAEMRIRGAILDELRTLDSMTSHGRRRLRQVQSAIAKLAAELGRQPEEPEIAAELRMSLSDYQMLCGELARGPALSRNTSVEPDDVPGESDDPSSLYSEAELRRALAFAIGQLPTRMQQVLALYYQEECTQAEIGQVLGVTESRVCQILGEAAARLRSLLETSATTTNRRAECRTASTAH